MYLCKKKKKICTVVFLTQRSKNEVKEKYVSFFLLCYKNIIKIEAKFSILFYQFWIPSIFIIDLLSTIFVPTRFLYMAPQLYMDTQYL